MIFPRTTAKGTCYIPRLGLGPRVETFLMYILSARVTPQDRHGTLVVECTEADGTIAMGVFAPASSFSVHGGLGCGCFRKNIPELRIQKGELIDFVKRCLEDPGENLEFGSVMFINWIPWFVGAYINNVLALVSLYCMRTITARHLFNSNGINIPGRARHLKRLFGIFL